MIRDMSKNSIILGSFILVTGICVSFTLISIG